MRIGRRAFLVGLAVPAGAEIVVSATGATARFNFGASGTLQKQIEAGAPADVFISAGRRQMDELEAKGLIDRGTRRNLARNTVVLVVPAGPGAGIRRFADLGAGRVRRRAIGNPKSVPAGQYARQVLDYVARGEVDAGIVYGAGVGSGCARRRDRESLRGDRPLAPARRWHHQQLTGCQLLKN